MKCNLLNLSVLVFILIFGCESNSKSTDDISNEIANSTEIKKEPVGNVEISNLRKLNSKDYWGKKLVDKGRDLTGIYFKETKKKGNWGAKSFGCQCFGNYPNAFQRFFEVGRAGLGHCFSTSLFFNAKLA